MTDPRVLWFTPMTNSKSLLTPNFLTLHFPHQHTFTTTIESKATTYPEDGRPNLGRFFNLQKYHPVFFNDTSSLTDFNTWVKRKNLLKWSKGILLHWPSSWKFYGFLRTHRLLTWPVVFINYGAAAAPWFSFSSNFPSSKGYICYFSIF